MDKIMSLNEWMEESYGELAPNATSRYLSGAEMYEIRYEGERQQHHLLGRIPEALAVVELDWLYPGHEPDEHIYIGPAAAIEQVQWLHGDIIRIQMEIRRLVRGNG